MGPEVLIIVAAAFISGGAIGAAGILLTQWLLGGLRSEADRGPRAIDPMERDVLRQEVAELHKHLRNMDARLDFTERLLDGALPLAPPPERMPAPEIRDDPRETSAPTDQEGPTP